MAVLPAIEIQARNGAPVLLRCAQRGDAAMVALYKRQVLDTSEFLNTEPDEIEMSARSERLLIAKLYDGPRDLMLLALEGKQLIGILETKTPDRRRLGHSTEIGVSIAAPWRGQGVGRALIVRHLDWARRHPDLSRVELHVHSGNAPALALYRALGFQEEGRRRGAIRYADGRLADDILMCLYTGDADMKAGRMPQREAEAHGA